MQPQRNNSQNDEQTYQKLLEAVEQLKELIERQQTNVQQNDKINKNGQMKSLLYAEAALVKSHALMRLIPRQSTIPVIGLIIGIMLGAYVGLAIAGPFGTALAAQVYTSGMSEKIAMSTVNASAAQQVGKLNTATAATVPGSVDMVGLTVGGLVGGFIGYKGGQELLRDLKEGKLEEVILARTYNELVREVGGEAA
ncbi:MAG: hypothetical protein [aquatic viral metagenome]